jgi:hypothetical protein
MPVARRFYTHIKAKMVFKLKMFWRQQQQQQSFDLLLNTMHLALK